MNKFRKNHEYAWHHIVAVAGVAWAAALVYTGIAPDWWHGLLLGFVISHTFK